MRKITVISILVLAALLFSFGAYAGSFFDTSNNTDESGVAFSTLVKSTSYQGSLMAYGLGEGGRYFNLSQPTSSPALMSGKCVIVSLEGLKRKEVLTNGTERATSIGESQISSIRWTCSQGSISTQKLAKIPLGKLQAIWRLPHTLVDTKGDITCLIGTKNGERLNLTIRNIPVLSPPKILGSSPIPGRTNGSATSFIQTFELGQIPYSRPMGQQLVSQNCQFRWNASVGNFTYGKLVLPNIQATGSKSIQWMYVGRTGGLPKSVVITCTIVPYPNPELFGDQYVITQKSFALGIAAGTPPVASPTNPIVTPPVASTSKPLPPVATTSLYIDPQSSTTINPQIPGSKGKIPDVVKDWTISALRGLLQDVFNLGIIDGICTWTQKQLFELYKTLYSLPKTFSKYLLQLTREKVAFNNPNILGYMYWNRPSQIYICDSAFSYGVFSGTTIHEMAHLFTAQKPQLETQWRESFYVKNSAGQYSFKTTPPTSYGCTNIREDIAESVRSYWVDGESMKRLCPDRYEFVRKYFMDNVEYRNSLK
ncbi:MAG: hypothetical protein WA705_15455 [Candidatus Ozemobacteraceae bacterium]